LKNQEKELKLKAEHSILEELNIKEEKKESETEIVIKE